MRVGVVLGAGGVAGMHYHAGVLHALAEVGGVEVSDADLLVGTSAGSIMASVVRGGWSANDCWEFGLGIHPLLLELDEAEAERRAQAVLTRGFVGPLDLARRSVGSAFVLARSLVRVPAPPVPGFLRRSFPGGLFSVAEARSQLAEVVPGEWPERPLYLVAVDIDTGRRVVLGREGSPDVPLREAVLASCAIPGVYPPVRAGGMTLVDGGVYSSTNLDLATRAGCELIIGIAPMAFDPGHAPSALDQLARRVPARAVQNEARRARAAGAQVLLVRPTAEELAVTGRRYLRPADGPAIALAAFDATARLLETPRFRETLAEVAV